MVSGLLRGRDNHSWFPCRNARSILSQEFRHLVAYAYAGKKGSLLRYLDNIFRDSEREFFQVLFFFSHVLIIARVAVYPWYTTYGSVPVDTALERNPQ